MALAARLLIVGVGLFMSQPVEAFPGLCVTSSGVTPVLGTTHMVVMQHADISVITTMVDYQGPVQPFALVLPVPSDVTQRRLQTVKHEFIARLEEVTAPRLVDFWEKDPCAPGPVAQAWDTKVPVKGRGFLTPSVLPPRDTHYPVSNELSVPKEPVFKRAENEFRYHLLRPRSQAQLESWLRQKGYRVEDSSLSPLAPFLAKQSQILVAEVLTDHVELVAAEQVQLGGIRYWSRQPLQSIAANLGTRHSKREQDLFIYALTPEKRYEVANYDNVFLPTNLSVRPGLGPKLGMFYNALHDIVRTKHPRAFVTEFVGSTETCGEPCPNAPLQLRELMTLGGDILETYAHPQVADSQSPEAGARSAAHPQALREHRALVARQRYLVTRLHYRYAADAMPHAVELAQVGSHVRGGFGLPKGPAAELPRQLEDVESGSAYQVRVSASHVWQGRISCERPERWRWGARWKSHSQHWSKIYAARDLPRLGRPLALLKSRLLTPLPELGFSGVPKQEPARQARPRSVASAEAAGCARTSCALTQGAPGAAWPILAFCVACTRRRRCPGPPGANAGR